MDLRTQQIRWFDTPFDGMRPRLAGHLLELTWPGWKSIWTPEGVRGFFPIDGFAEVERAEPLFGRGAASRPIEDLRHLAMEWAADSPWRRTAVDSILSVRGEDGIVSSIAVDVMLDVVSELRAEWVVDHVSRECLRVGVQREALGPVDNWPGGALVSERGEEWPHQGLFVDLATRRATWWSEEAEPELAAAFAINWPGFVVESRGDDHEWHEREARIGGVHPPLAVMLQVERTALGRRAAERVSSARTAHRAVVMDALDDLIASGVDALPPARYVDSHGVVVEPAGEGAHRPGR